MTFTENANSKLGIRSEFLGLAADDLGHDAVPRGQRQYQFAQFLERTEADACRFDSGDGEPLARQLVGQEKRPTPHLEDRGCFGQAPQVIVEPPAREPSFTGHHVEQGTQVGCLGIEVLTDRREELVHDHAARLTTMTPTRMSSKPTRC